MRFFSQLVAGENVENWQSVVSVEKSVKQQHSVVSKLVQELMLADTEMHPVRSQS
jgi:hypothetical protein